MWKISCFFLTLSLSLVFFVCNGFDGFWCLICHKGLSFGIFRWLRGVVRVREPGWLCFFLWRGWPKSPVILLRDWDFWISCRMGNKINFWVLVGHFAALIAVSLRMLWIGFLQFFIFIFLELERLGFCRKEHLGVLLKDLSKPPFDFYKLFKKFEIWLCFKDCCSIWSAFHLLEEIPLRPFPGEMACMKLGSKSDAFQRQGQAWFVS